jgi:DNA-binding NarL/FixJ family response regulator
MAGTGSVETMRVVIVDDHPITRQGLRAAFALTESIDVVGEASSGEQAVILVDELLPDVVFMDIRMPGMGGLEATRIIRAQHPDVKVIVFSVDESRASVNEAIRSGVAGYLLKDVGADELERAARLAMEGKAVIHPSLTKIFLEETRMVPRESKSPLSDREVQILQRVAYGASTREVAEELGISTHTVKTHVDRIFEKLEANDRAQAVAIAVRNGIIE